MKFRLITILVFTSVFPLSCARAQTVEEVLVAAEAALGVGSYEEAIAGFEAVWETDSLRETAARGLVRSMVSTGRYDAALAWLGTIGSPGLQPSELNYLQGTILAALGQYEAAEESLVRAIEHHQEHWGAMVALGDLYRNTGRGAEARPPYLQVYRAFRAGNLRTAENVMLAARAAEHLGGFREANEAYGTAHELGPQHVDNLRYWGQLFARKYNTADAQRTLEEALAINENDPDLLAAYAETQGAFEQKEAYARRALATNPRHVRSLGLLAELSILDGLYDDAFSQIDSALSVNPRDVHTLGQLASVHLLIADSTAYLNTERLALETDPSSGPFYRIVAENLARRFRYPDAVSVTEKAVLTNRREPRNLAAYGAALMRTGRLQEARRYLDQAFEGDPFDLYTGNTLTLLDAFDGFVQLDSEHFELLLPADEAVVLGPMMLEEAEACYAALVDRYPYRPAAKIRVEAYGDHDDFAVRVGGIPHLGILGVAFGDVVALDTPRAQQGNAYNWARTLWHELAHTMAIGISNFRVPRWFTEGLSVYEERRARPEWHRKRELELHLAMDQDRLLPLAEIDRGFTRPQFPGQVGLSYFHASRIIGHIDQQYGFESVVSILKRLGQGWSINESIEDVLGVTPESLDTQFRSAMATERLGLAHILDDLPNLLEGENEEEPVVFSTLREGNRLLRAGDFDEAESHFLSAMEEMPYWTRPGNAYEGLATIYRERDDVDQLAFVLESYLGVSEYGAREARELAQIHQERGDTEKAAACLRRSFDSEPYVLEARLALGRLLLELGDGRRAADEFRAVLDLDPLDTVELHYDLARSLILSNDRMAAKRALLMALEVAPGYRDAQRLLLQLVDDS